MRLTLYDLSHLRYRNLIASPVEDGSIVVDVLNFDRNGADALQRGSPTIARLQDIRIKSNSSSNKWNRYPSGGGTVGLGYQFKNIGLFQCSNPSADPESRLGFRNAEMAPGKGKE